MTKEKIIQKIAETEKLIGEYKDFTQPISPDNAYGRLSRMDAIMNKSVTEATLNRTKKKLESLNRILAMYGSDDFAKCVNCRIEIPINRILFRPESLYCINSANLEK